MVVEVWNLKFSQQLRISTLYIYPQILYYISSLIQNL